MNRYRCTYRDPRQPDAPWQQVVVQADTAMVAARTLENLALEVMDIVLVGPAQAS